MDNIYINADTQASDCLTEEKVTENQLSAMSSWGDYTNMLNIILLQYVK